MFTLYFKQALRHLSRQKAFSCINILGLALSLACCIVLSRYLYRELNVDAHMIDSENVYVVYRNSDTFHDQVNLSALEETFEPALKNVLDAEVVETCRYVPYPDCPMEFHAQERNVNALVADSLLLHFFDYHVEGDIQALSRPDGCWLSRHLFDAIGLPVDSLMGKSVRFINSDFIISGVFDEPEGATILCPDVIISIYASRFWGRSDYEWLRMREGFDAEAFNRTIMNYQQTSLQDRRFCWGDQLISFELKPWKNYYYDVSSILDNSKIKRHGNLMLLWILTAVMFLLLIVGMSNFINLFLVSCQRRGHESGVRKVFGQKSSQLFFELWTELFLLVLLALMVAWLMVELFSPWVEEMLGSSMHYSPFDAILVMIMLVVLPLLALCFPYGRQVHRSPLVSLQQRAGSVQSLKSRTLILAFQYLITFTILISSLWLQDHLKTLLFSPTGFDIEHILIAKPLKVHSGYYNDEQGNMQWKTDENEVRQLSLLLIDKLKQSPAIEKITIAGSTPIRTYLWEDVFYNDKDEGHQLEVFSVSSNWFDIFGIPVECGQLLSDVTGKKNHYRVNQWVVNEQALRVMGYRSISGAHIRNQPHWESDPEPSLPVGALVGSHYPRHRTLGASAIIYQVSEEWAYENGSMLVIRAYPGQDEAALEYLQKACQEICPNHQLEYHWFSEEVEELYRDDRKIAAVYSLFAGIAILICCLGLLGLSLFDIRQRYREIAIRKAHGAHRKDLYLLLGKKYIYVLLVTFAVSVPITYLFIHHYTESFVEYAPLTPLIYAEALGIVTLITVLTLIYQLERAARVNVANMIKTE